MNPNKLKHALESLNIGFSEEMMIQLENYYHFLIEYNQHTNLTAITDRDSVYLKHFYDSLVILKYYPLPENTHLIDLGSGAGFPGMVLAIFNPKSQFVLIDGVGKKTKFLSELKSYLNLNNVTVVNARIEDYAHLNSEKFDFVTARAVSSLSILGELSARLLKINGTLLALKGKPEEELLNVNKFTTKLNLQLVKVSKYNLPIENSDRSIIELKKIKLTPKLYPRNYGQIKKNPL